MELIITTTTNNKREEGGEEKEKEKPSKQRGRGQCQKYLMVFETITCSLDWSASQYHHSNIQNRSSGRRRKWKRKGMTEPT